MSLRASTLGLTFLLVMLLAPASTDAAPNGKVKIRRGSIAAVGKAVGYDFVIPPKHLAIVSLKAPAGPVDFAVVMKDPAGKVVYRQKVEDGSAKPVAFLSGPIFAPARGSYQVVVADVGNDDASTTQVYELGLRVFPDPDPNELNHGENNDIGRARATKITSGKTVKAMVSHRGDEDWYVIEGKIDQIIDVRMDNGTAAKSAVDYSIGLYDRTGSRFYTDWHRGEEGPTSFHVRMRIPATGPVYLCVWDRDGDDYESEQFYEITATVLDPLDRNEPNYTDFPHETADSHRARLVSSGETVTALLETMDDTDWYRIEAKEGQIVDVKLDNVPVLRSGLQYSLGYFDESFECLWQNWWRTENAPLKVHARLQARRTGPMYIRIWDRDGTPRFETKNPYHLTVSTLDGPDGHEINSGTNEASSKSRATVLEGGKTIRGWIEAFNDEDWFRIDLVEGQLLDVALSSLASDRLDVDLTLVVSNDGGTTLYDDWTRKSAPRKVEFTVACRQTGPHYLRLYDRDHDDFDGEHPYELTATPKEDPDGFEPNDGPNLAASFLLATTLTKNRPVSAYIQHRGDRDYYLVAHEGGPLKLAFDGPVNPDVAMRFGLTVYDPDGNQIFSDWSGPSAPVRHRFERELPAGRYHVSIWTKDLNHSARSAYRLLWGEEAAAVAPPRIALLRATPPSLSAPGKVSVQWVTQNAEHVRLQRRSTGGTIDVAARGRATVHLAASERFEIQASRGDEVQKRAVAVFFRPTLPDLPHPPFGLHTQGGDDDSDDDSDDTTSGSSFQSGNVGLGNVTPITLPTATPAPSPSREDDIRRHVVLVHGTLATAGQMAPLAGYLERLTDEKGRRLFACHAVTLTGRALKAGIAAYAKELRNFVAGELPADAPFDLVGYSQGGPICRLYASRYDDAKRVGKVITLCATNHGTALGLISRIATAAGIAAGAPIVLPYLQSTPIAATISITAPATAAAGHAGAYAVFRSIKDQELGSEVLTKLYDDPKARALDVHAIWYLRDRVVIPHHSACIQGGKNYPLDLAAHLKAPRTPEVHRLVEGILRGTATRGEPRRMDLKAMIALKMVRASEYANLPLAQLVADVNGVLDKTVVLDRAEEALVTVLRAVRGRGDWPEIWKRLDHEALWKKFQGEEVDQLYEIIGPTAPILRALAKKSKLVLTQDVRGDALKAADGKLRGELLNFLLARTPLSTDLHEMILQTLACAKAESQAALDELLRTAGGADRLYGLVWLPARKSRLQALVPAMKPCPRCRLSKKKGHVQTWVSHEVRVDCPQCTGGLKTCSWCKGTCKQGSDHPCPKCNGTGKHTCSWCGGDGKTGNRNQFKCKNPLFKGMSKHVRPCPKCGGDGVIEAPACKNPLCGKGCAKGKVKCTNLRCKGTGSWVETRKTLEWTPCPECKGKGEVPR